MLGVLSATRAILTQSNTVGIAAAVLLRVVSPLAAIVARQGDENAVRVSRHRTLYPDKSVDTLSKRGTERWLLPTKLWSVYPESPSLISGAHDQTRTGDPHLTKMVLCQLSYVGLRKWGTWWWGQDSNL